MPLKWVLMSLLIGMAMVQVNSQECSWLTYTNSDCTKRIDCKDDVTVVAYIWESCTIGEELFTITNDTFTLQACEYAEGNPTILLKKELDAEGGEQTKSCKFDETLQLFFEALDINEFPPYPSGDTLPVMEVDIMENQPPREITKIYYTDDDDGETVKLEAHLISTMYEDIFTLVKGTVEENKLSFSFRTLKELDFESGAFYKVAYSIVSMDERGNRNNVTHTFFVNVNDAPDNKPFWTTIVPFYELDECQDKDELFTVTAQDRDVMVNYKIRYSFTEASEYFEIDSSTGAVRNTSIIDREDLLEIGISSFSLGIRATEYNETSGEDGEEPNSSEQVTVITIKDCNDEIPEFNKYTFEIEMDEVTKTSGNKNIPISIVVSDMDEGDSGTFTLETNRIGQVDINPKVGQQQQEVTLTALYIENGQSLFNFEDQRDNPIHIEITATEKADASHFSVANVTITLHDVNDEAPFFFQETYSANVTEGSSLHTDVLMVEADDEDVTPEYGKASIRYSLESSCNEFAIDRETGIVTLEADLNYEDGKNLIVCKVYARDENGTGLTNSDIARINITVIDVVDEAPRFEFPLNPMEILENSVEDEMVGTLNVTDADADASISFSIVKYECSDGIASADVDGWFKVELDTPDPPEFMAKLKVGNVNIDREQCKEVTLTIEAKDDNTDEGYESESSDTETFIITILDENDEPPVIDCVDGCDDISLDEVDAINPSDASVFVFRVTVTDPDESDTISISLGEGKDLMDLSKDTVTVQAGSEELIEVWTKTGADIDREKQDTIPVEIFLVDSKDHVTRKTISVKVRDLNDVRPVIDPGLCGGEPLNIEEDDGSGSKNGISIGVIHATDGDKESPHNKVMYMMLNDQIVDSKNAWCPFAIDEKTGNVTIRLIEGEKALDREQFSDWELLFRAYDDCDSSPTCKILTSQPDCIVKINVTDVNDHAPRDLTWLPYEPIEVDDFLKKDEDLGYRLYALDDDEGMNASLTYSVLGTYPSNSDQDMGLFRAEDESFTTMDSCRLYANQDFEGMNFTGLYNVVLEAKDGGNLSTAFNISINVVDANDKAPYFIFGGCPGEPQKNIIKMEENYYRPGENGNPDKMEVACIDGRVFTIETVDDDILPVNQEVTVSVDRENSTVENLGDDVSEDELLSYWSVEPEDCLFGCKLLVSHLIDREKGSAYNLSLHVKNTASPHLESWERLLVVVTNKMEFDPYFCTNGYCSQIVYMEENDPSVEATFYNATDEDNNGVSQGDEEYDNVYYYIVEGDKGYFQIPNEFEEKIVLKNLPDGLDREKTGEYSLKILATNYAGNDGGDFDIPRNDTLNLIIRVLDVNDNDPAFDDDVIFTSFMQSYSVNAPISTIEAIDVDLNETLTYDMHDDLQCFETDFTPTDPFKLERKDNRSVYLILNFDPKGMSRGYCNFTIDVQDAAGHEDEAVVKVYVINEDYQVTMYFSNSVDDVQSKKKEIEDIYTSVYSYKCTIDSIVETLSSSGDPLTNKTTVYMHFIDEEKNEPVDDKIILDLSDNAEIMTRLIQRLDLIGIKLDSVDKYTPPISEKNPEQKIKELQILLGVVSLVLGLFVLLLGTVYWLRTNNLQRKIKVLSTNTFGSKDGGLNQMGLDMASVPGSNYLAKEHGNHNPVFSESGGLGFENQDTESISSGDSVLVGVEDNPEFKSYLAKGTPMSSSQGIENSTYGRSIDDVSAAPPGVQGGMKGNPLLNLGDLKDKSSKGTIYDRNSVGSQDNNGSVNQNFNDDFSFS